MTTKYNAQAMKMRRLPLMKEALLLSIICLLIISCKNKASEQSTLAETGTEQPDVYQPIKKAIYTNDTAKFDSLLPCIPVIDSLLPEKEADLSYTLLGHAIKSNNLDFIQKLIDAKADINKAYETLYNTRDALYLSLECKSDSIVKLLLENGADPNKIYDENGTSLLLLSCSDRECNDISKLLLAHGANINGLAEKDSSLVNSPYVYPLYVAIKNCNFEMVEYLIANGCSLSFGDETAIDIARKNNLHELADFIDQYILEQYQLVEVDESWYGTYGYTTNVDSEDWRSQLEFSITIRPDSCIFEGTGYQLFFQDLCTIKNEKQDTIQLYYYYTLDGSNFNSRDPYLGMLFRKDGKYYLNSSALCNEAVYNKDVEVERSEIEVERSEAEVERSEAEVKRKLN